MSIPAVFIDKDGTLIEDVPYNAHVERIRLSEGALEGLRNLVDLGFKLIVITNQGGVAKGLLQEKDVVKMKDYLSELLSRYQIDLMDFYYCPHHPAGTVDSYAHSCSCRKPSPGMIERARDDHDIDLSRSWMIGDILDDVECGRRAGCRTILINNGHETEWKLSPWRIPDAVAVDLEQASRVILGQKGQYESLGKL